MGWGTWGGGGRQPERGVACCSVELVAEGDVSWEAGPDTGEVVVGFGLLAACGVGLGVGEGQGRGTGVGAAVLVADDRVDSGVDHRAGLVEQGLLS